MLHQDGNKLAVENLDKPVQISVPVSAAADLETSCAGQPSDLQLVNSMGQGTPGCLDAMECRYYDHKASAWSTEGCKTTQYNRSGTSAIGCSCNHLSDYVAVKVPTSLREKLDLALVHLPPRSQGAAAGQNLAIILKRRKPQSESPNQGLDLSPWPLCPDPRPKPHPLP